MKSCSCTLPHVDPNACKNCSNMDIDDFGVYGGTGNYTRIVIDNEEAAVLLINALEQSDKE